MPGAKVLFFVLGNLTRFWCSKEGSNKYKTDSISESNLQKLESLQNKSGSEKPDDNMVAILQTNSTS
jgi:hypothetical protein